MRLALAVLLAASPAAAGPREDARAAEARGDAPGALSAWQRAAELDPGDAEAALGFGRLQLRTGHPEQAAQTLAGLVEKRPDTPRARYWLAFALRKAGRLPEAAEQYRLAIAAEPEDPDARFGQAETLKALGDGAGALEAYKAYVRLEARPSEAKWVARANEEIARLGASDVVTPEAPGPPGTAPGQAATPAAPGAGPASAVAASAPPHVSTPESAFAAGRYAEALQGYMVELSRSPDNVALHHRASVAALASGDYPEAERQAGAVLRLDPDNPTALAVALAARGHRPAPGAPTRAEAELALRDGRLRTAAELSGALLAADPTGPDAPALARIRGTALLQLGRADEAQSAFRAGGGQAESPGEYWLALGDALARGGDRQAARRAWRVAAELTEPDTPIGRLSRARFDPAGLRVQEQE